LITARVRREALLIRVEVRDLPPLTLSQQGGEAATSRRVVYEMTTSRSLSI